jgi:hypothetical protein
VDFHHILLASFPAHSLALLPAHSPCHSRCRRRSRLGRALRGSRLR